MPCGRATSRWWGTRAIAGSWQPAAGTSPSTTTIDEEACYDGKWVLTTNTELAAGDAAVNYKQLWMVEDIFRSMMSLLETSHLPRVR